METINTSVKSIARIAGVFYLIIIITGLFGEMVVRENLIVWNNPTATAENLMASDTLWRLGIAGDLIQHVFDIGLLVALYFLLKPVSRYLALAALLFHLTTAAVLVATKLNQWQALFPLGTDTYLNAFTTQQLYTLSHFYIRADAYGFGIGLIFFGFACILYGYMIYNSGYFPKIIGVLMILAGLCYITNSFALIISPGLAQKLFPLILAPSFIGELAFTFWLIVKGPNLEKWREKQNLRKQVVE